MEISRTPDALKKTERVFEECCCECRQLAGSSENGRTAVMRYGAKGWSMQRWLVSPMLFAAAMAAVGCSSSRSVTPAASPAATSAQAACERNGAVWRAALNFCEYQAPGSPTPAR
jgi:hypothetical protein